MVRHEVLILAFRGFDPYLFNQVPSYLSWLESLTVNQNVACSNHAEGANSNLEETMSRTRHKTPKIQSGPKSMKAAYRKYSNRKLRHVKIGDLNPVVIKDIYFAHYW